MIVEGGQPDTFGCERVIEAGNAMDRLKTVIHVHTNYSFDGNASPEDVLETARRQGVDCVAITDHDEIEGALIARDRSRDVRVIVGEEVSSAGGHIIGLFLEQRIPSGLSLQETAERIKQQGGLVLAPHPFSILCEDSLRANTARLLPWLDAVEVCNAQDPLPWEDSRALRFALRHDLVPYVGADSHIRGHLDACHQLMPSFDGPAEFLASLRVAERRPGQFGLSYFLAMGGRHVWDKVSPWRWPGFGTNSSPIPVAGV